MSLRPRKTLAEQTEMLSGPVLSTGHGPVVKKIFKPMASVYTDLH